MAQSYDSRIVGLDDDVADARADSKHLLTFGSSKVHGIDFSYQGILGIWEGLEASTPHEMASLLDSLDLASPSESSQNISKELGPTVDVNASLRPRPSAKHSQRLGDGFHGNYSAALNTLNSRTNSDKTSWKPTVHTEKPQQRKLALALCDWRVDADEISRWEREGKYSQAACWLLFTNQGGRAIDVLLNSQSELDCSLFSILSETILQMSHFKCCLELSQLFFSQDRSVADETYTIIASDSSTSYRIRTNALCFHMSCVTIGAMF